MSMNFDEMEDIYNALATIKSMCNKQKLCNLGCPLCKFVDEEKLDCILKEFVMPKDWSIIDPPTIRWQALEERKRVIFSSN